jgi:hypothetical protein
MGMQFLLRAPTVEAVATSLGDFSASCEIFSVSQGLVGLSIPAKIVDTVGEEIVLRRVRRFAAYELWSGKWHEQPAPQRSATKPRWKFW